jgi:ribosomal protein S18 acetylase RimI-like enzyme
MAVSGVMEAQATRLIIRAFEEADYPAIVAIWQTTGQRIFTAAQLTRLLRCEGGALVAERHEEGGAPEVVGVLLWGHNGQAAYLYRLAVAQAHRKLGIASALVAQAEADIRAAGFVRIGLHVYDANTPAAALYRAHGYELRDDVGYWSKNLTPQEPADCGGNRSC